MRPIKLRHGFSLVESAVVLLIIGFIIAGTLSASRVVNYMLLNTARKATENTTINYIRRDVLAWFDTTSEYSFTNSEIIDGGTISNWYETNPITATRAVATQSTESSKPIYVASAINGLPALKFDGVDDLMSIASLPYITASGPSFYNNFSVFLVAQATRDITGASGQSGQRYALFPASGDTIYPSMYGATAGSGISFGLNGIGCYENADSYTPSMVSSSSGYSSALAILMEYKNKTPRLYINGKLIQSGSASIKNYVFPPFYIGGGPSPWATYGNFSGNIGEIIIIDRPLTAEERSDIFIYLRKKWKLNY